MKIIFLAAEGCLPSGITGLMDCFTIANLWHGELTGCRTPLFTTEIVSADGGPVTSGGSIRLLAGKSIDDTDDADYIVIPPFIPVPRADSPQLPRLARWLVGKHAAGIPIAALCTGSFLLAETGLLNGRVATTHWQFARKFSRRYPQVLLKPEEILTEDDRLVCTGAATSYFNFGIAFIERYGSRELADICAKSLLVDPHRNSQAPYFFACNAARHSDARIAKAQRFMEENYAGIGSVDQIADHACLSSRHFKRRFKNALGISPLAFLQDLRIEAAKKRLEASSDSIDDITEQIGYENAGTFRRLFKQRTSLSPREYRDKFAPRNLQK